MYLQKKRSRCAAFVLGTAPQSPAHVACGRRVSRPYYIFHTEQKWAGSGLNMSYSIF